MISFIYGFKDRSLERVRKTLETLYLQSEMAFEVIFVDYGSDRSLALEVEKLILSYDFARYIYSNHRGRPWNRSQCLNIGLSEARFEYVFTCDVDIWFPPNFVRDIVPMLSLDSMIYPPVYYLPKSIKDLSVLRNKTKYGEYRGGRGIAIIPREKLIEIGGYDEFYFHWGFEDVDLYQRLRAFGLKEISNSDSIWLYHYWHPISHGLLPNYCPVTLSGTFQYYLQENEGEIIRNSNGWGKRLCDKDRPTVKIAEEMQWNRVDRIFAQKPSQLLVLAEFSQFLGSKSEGEILGIDYANYPRNYTSLLRIVNALLRRIGFDEISSPVNYIHSFLFELMLQKRIEINDYYINSNYKRGLTLIQ